MKKAFTSIFLLALVYACTSPLMAGVKHVTVIYSGNLDGELEPCGCTDEGNLGGIKRRSSLLNKLRNQHSDAFVISSGGLISSEGSTDRIKAEFILKAFVKLRYDVIAVQWRDLAYGFDFFNQTKLPWVASNWNDDRIPRTTMVKRVVGGEELTLQFFNWLDPDREPQAQMQGSHSNVNSDRDTFLKQIAEAKNKKHFVVLSTTLPIESVKESFPLSDIDIVFLQPAYEEFSEPQKLGSTLLLQVGSRGMRLGKLNLELDKNNEIKKWQHEVIPMPEAIGDDPSMQAWYDEYNAKVKQDYEIRVALRKSQQTGESNFVGVKQCETCHMQQFETWKSSQHAVAYEDLESVNKAFDPACLLCHTVGFEQPGGFVDMSITSHLLNVQCENCHGAAKAHVKSNGMQPVKNKGWPREKMCAQCHTQPHSPSFNFDKYWPKIAH